MSNKPIQLVKLNVAYTFSSCLLHVQTTKRINENYRASQYTEKNQSINQHLSISTTSRLPPIWSLQALPPPHRMWLLENDESPISRTGV